MQRLRALRGWLAIQALALAALALAFLLVDGLVGHLAATLPYGHGLVKQAMGVVHTLLVRQQQWPGLFAGAALGALVLPWLPPRAWAVLGALLAGGAALLLDSGSPLLVLPFAAAIVLSTSPRGVAWLAWLPGAVLVLPGQVLHGLGLRTPARAAALTLPAALLLAGAWLALDSLLFIHRQEQDVTWWPEELTEPGATVLARAPQGIHCEFHDVDVFEDRIIVVGEASGTIFSFPRQGGPPGTVDVPSDWGDWGGLVLDTASDPLARKTWFLDGERQVTTLRWTPTGLERAGSSPPLPRPLHHAYTFWLEHRRQLVLADVNVKGSDDPPKLTVLEGPGLDRIRVLPVHTADGELVPIFRQVTWVPPLDAFVMAPDLGQRLYRVDPDSGLAQAWLDVPTANGRMIWVPERGQLVYALPDRRHLWIIDPAGPTVVRRIATQPGVRAVAVDAQRGLVLAGSVLTGQVWVHDLDSGELLRRLGGFMPMMRELALLREEGEAVLSTWGMLYRFSYLPEGA